MLPYTWFSAALAAAVLWGFGYALLGKVLHSGVSPAFVMLVQGIVALPLYLLIAKFTTHIKQDWDVLSADGRIFLFAVLFSVSIVIGNFLVFTSISMKNATLANMIEIAYPFFTFLFTWVLFREGQLNAATAFGGFLIFCGVSLVYWKS